jgi:hypothetical protein
MGNENCKKLTITQSVDIAIEERMLHARQLEKEMTALELSFPDIYKDISAYICADAALAGTRSGIKLEHEFMGNYAELDDVLKKLLERVPLKPINYGYWLIRDGVGKDFPFMERIQSWNYDRCMHNRSNPGYMMTEYSVFSNSALYFAFPKYSGAILYMRRMFCGSSIKPQLALEIGLQIVDNYDAYKEPCIDLQEYPAITYVVLSNETDMRALARTGISDRDPHPFQSRLTLLNLGYCQGICKTIAEIILSEHPDVFAYKYPKTTNEKE